MIHEVTRSTASLYIVNAGKHAELLTEIANELNIVSKRIVSIRELVQRTPLSRPACVVYSDANPVDGDRFCDIKQAGALIPMLYLEQHRPGVCGESTPTLPPHVDPANLAELKQWIQLAIDVDEHHHHFERCHTRVQDAMSRLTPRQKDVLACVMESIPTKSIAKKHDVSTRLIEMERSEILRAFEATSTPQLTAIVSEFETVKKVYWCVTRIREMALRCADPACTCHNQATNYVAWTDL